MSFRTATRISFSPCTVARDIAYVGRPSGRASAVSDERLFLQSVQALQLVLALQRSTKRTTLLGIDEPDRTTACGVLSAAAAVVSLLARSRIARIAGVERSVGAADDINKVHSNTDRRRP